jgi:D-alanine transaminase
VELAWVNGVVSLARDARVSALDRGFLYGDAVYEVVRVYARRPWHLRAHLERLAQSAAGLRFGAFPSLDVLEHAGRSLFAQSGLLDGRLYYEVTRGAGQSRGAALNALGEPTVVIMTEPIRPPSPETYAQGVVCVCVPEQRWERSDLKTTNLMPRILVKMDAEARGAYEALWMDTSGCVREGTATNVFAVRGQRLLTHPLEPGVVAGITRSAVLALAARVGLAPDEVPLTYQELVGASEAFLTGTTPEVLAIREIDGQSIGTGAQGPYTRALHVAYREHVAQVLASVPPCEEV